MFRPSGTPWPVFRIFVFILRAGSNQELGLIILCLERSWLLLRRRDCEIGRVELKSMWGDLRRCYESSGIKDQSVDYLGKSRDKEKERYKKNK